MSNKEHKKHSHSEEQAVYYLAPQMPVDEDEINLLDYWRILMRYKWLIIVLTVISASASIA
ncbi:MAG: hypothetical protein R3240_10550, partial [Gammaproteobacteria bacterium]|nr:hypothetical protein [Gammaproteobacteria bacterium]